MGRRSNVAYVTEVVVVGAAGVDTCVYLPEHVDGAADATFTDNRDGVGQAGGYAARGYAALGYRTAYCGAIGADEAGALVRRVLTAEGIDLGSCFDDPAGTARSVNLMGVDGRRRGFYDGRGNPGLAPDLAPVAAQLEGARLCHVNIPNWARQVLPLARIAGATILTDLQDVRSADDGYRDDFVVGSDIVCFSTTNLASPDELMQAYWARNPRLVLLAGMGAAGCAVGVGGIVRRFPPPPVDLPLLDTNGAGDALAVGFATAYVLEGLSVEAAVERGQLAARLTCAQRVPKSPLATRDALARLVATMG
jgi:sugar/nucleoside kinase (ribokinase family)